MTHRKGMAVHASQHLGSRGELIAAGSRPVWSAQEYQGSQSYPVRQREEKQPARLVAIWMQTWPLPEPVMKGFPFPLSVPLLKSRT